MDLLNKLKINKEESLFLQSIPSNLSPIFSEYENKVILKNTKNIKQVLCFVTNKIMLENTVNSVLEKMNTEGLLWIIYPKKSGNILSDLSRDESWKVFENTDWQPVTSVSFDENWSALRFRHTSQIKNLKRTTPINDRVIEGIDFKNRKVVLPLDAEKALKKISGLFDFFHSLSFTHKKEYVESIVTAKKPETRQKRIEKMITMVQQLKDSKEKKAKNNEL